MSRDLGLVPPADNSSSGQAKGKRVGRFRAGTSGWSYPDWKDGFYPEGVAQRNFLDNYAERFPATELNASFYRLPSEKMIDGWLEEGRSVWAFFNNTNAGHAWRDAEKLNESVARRMPEAVPF